MQGIVIQGPTQFYKEVADSWAGWPNVVWSTWTDEPKENLEYIANKGIQVLVGQKPIFRGDANVNLQALSTYNGLKFLQHDGVTEVLKIRSDHVVSDIKSFLELLYGKKIAFAALSNATKRGGFYYNLVYEHFAHDYPSDNVVYGKMDDMIKMWAFQTDQIYVVPPESLIICNYMNNSGMPFDLDFNHLKNCGISFFLGECLEKKVDIRWLKKDQSLIELYNNEYYLF
jgi:hypothetical protein